LRNLADKGQVDEVQVEVFGRLLRNLQLDQQLAGRVAAFVAAGQPRPVRESSPTGPGTGTTKQTPAGDAPRGRSSVAGSPMKFLAVDDLLTVPGFTPAMVERLRPFVIVLPDVTPVNVNTAPAEVLAALVPNMSVSEANSLVVRRQRAAWRGMNYFRRKSEKAGRSRPARQDVKSDWFLVNSRIRLDRAALDAEALIHRFPTLIGGRRSEGGVDPSVLKIFT
jgi:general secretion pathway protein K